MQGPSQNTKITSVQRAGSKGGLRRQSSAEAGTEFVTKFHTQAEKSSQGAINHLCTDGGIHFLISL